MHTVNLEKIAMRQNNNLDLIRLLFATFVIYGHSFALNPSPQMGSDIIFNLTGWYAGNIAIKGFFLISGFLVTSSISYHRSAVTYVISRVCRIWPALLMTILVTALVLGPLVTKLSLGEYLLDDGVWNYIWKTATFQNWGGQALGDFDLPGVFNNNAYPNNVNAPLWSINAEVFAYFIVLFAFLTGSIKRYPAIIILGLIVVDSLLPEKFLFYWLPQTSPDFSALPFCFAFGSVMSIFKKHITFNVYSILAILMLKYFLGGSLITPLLNYTMLFFLIFLCASSQFARKLALPYDISYGVFLYGWPIQQTIAYLFPDWAHMQSLSVSLVLSFIAGYFSCILVERPAQKFGKQLTAIILILQQKSGYQVKPQGRTVRCDTQK